MIPTKIQFISNKAELVLLLSQENNSYSKYILERIDRYSDVLQSCKTHAHHIIPLHFKGPDTTWNLILLTVEEHAQAHQLLYENYGKLADLGASQMLGGQFELGTETIRQMAQETMRTNKTAFFNSATQSELGSRPKKPRKPYSRDLYVTAAIVRGFSLVHSTGEVVTFAPFEYPNVIFVINKLMAHPIMEQHQEKWNTTNQKNKHYAVTALTRSLTGHIDSTSGKSVYSFMGWRILGININIE